MQEQIFISIGANLGDRASTMGRALRVIQEQQWIEELCCSQIYESEPVGYSNQPWFLNVVASGITSLSARELFTNLKDLEKRLGRKERARWHEREIDIDIIFFGNQEYSDELLSIPHPRWHERRFVLLPLIELIGGDAIPPRGDRKLETMLLECRDISTITAIGEKLL